MVSAERFWDRAAPKYSRQPVKNVAAWDVTLERTRRHMSPTDHVLEVGCGTGSSALRLAGA
ncbi:MAG: class I SAM-dependent methyltransferase, partial [Azospirillaceae bacterium]